MKNKSVKTVIMLEDAEMLIQEICEKIISPRTSIVNLDSAEFEFDYDNKVLLSSVELDETLIDEAVEEVINQWFHIIDQTH